MSESKVERLAIAAQIAPVLRGTSTELKKRKVITVDKDGNKVREVTVADVQKGLLEAKKIEIEVQEGIWPKEIICAHCGLPAPANKTGRLNSICENCRWVKCIHCGRELLRKRKSKADDGNITCLDCSISRSIDKLPTCTVCPKKTNRHSAIYRKIAVGSEPYICKVCRMARSPAAKKVYCYKCSGELSRSASYKFAKRGRPMMCNPCGNKSRRKESAV